MIQVKRIYESPAAGDGERLLVDRLWPRGVSKGAARLSAWLKDLAPSEELRRWFAHDPARWPEFQARYAAELAAPEKAQLLEEVARKARRGPVTLLYAARDQDRNNANVLKEVLEQLLRDDLQKTRFPWTSPLFPQWLSGRIVAEARDAIIFADREGLIRLWNRGAEEIFGHPAGAAVGQPLDLIIPKPLRERHRQGYERVMATGLSKYGRELLAVPGLRQDQVRVSLEFTITLVKDDHGQVLGAAAIIRDVTARWHQERERQQRLAQLEARLAALSSTRD